MDKSEKVEHQALGEESIKTDGEEGSSSPDTGEDEEEDAPVSKEYRKARKKEGAREVCTSGGRE